MHAESFIVQMGPETKLPFYDNLIAAEKWVLRNRSGLFWGAVIFMAFLAASRLAYQFWRLLIDTGDNGALDLRMLHEWTALWFAGEPLVVYNLLPGTYPLLWPLTGWLSFGAARWFWLVLYVISFFWLFGIIKSGVALRERKETVFLALFLLAMYPTSIIVGNGQLTLFIIPAVLAAILLGQERPSPGREAAITLLLLFSAIKLPISAPFFLVAFISVRAYRPVVLAIVGYVLLTLLAVHFRSGGLLTNIELWIRDSSKLAALGGYGNIHKWLSAAGLSDFILPASFALLIALAAWLYRNRRADIWIALGVTAMVARLWTYHRLYDDLLIIIPMIALFRIFKSGLLSCRERIAAAALLFISWLALLSPGFFLQLGPPLGTIFRTGQVTVWLLLLAFLLYHASTMERKN
jgi:hypothetical protein